MNTDQSVIVGVSLFFLLVFLSGIWLSRSGKPYATGIFTVHKLIGLAGGAFLAFTVYESHQVAPLGAVEIAAIAVTILLFVGTVAAGGLLSIDKPMPAAVTRLHLAIPLLTVLSTGGMLYLVLGAR